MGGYVYPPPVLTPNGNYHNTYDWQAGGTHPTGMLSCCICDCDKGAIDTEVLSWSPGFL